MNQAVDLRQFLAERRGEILKRWTQRVRSAHPGRDIRCEKLQDHLALFFDKLLRALQEQGEPRERELAALSLVRDTERPRVEFELSEVMREYAVLAECILEESAALGGMMPHVQLRRALRVLEKERVKAIAAYLDRRDAERARAQSQHIAFVAHEQRGPLMAAFNAVAALRTHGRAEDQWALGLLRRNLTALRELIERAPLEDRLTDPLPLLRRAPLDVMALLQEVEGELRPTATPRQVRIRIAGPKALVTHADPHLLRSAISNVLSNAVKFTRADSNIEVRVHRDNDRIRLEFEDQCGGLPPGRPQDLLLPYVQRSADKSGFGLGLAIVKQAIEAHGGRVEVRNCPGKGCIFRLDVPVSTVLRLPNQKPQEKALVSGVCRAATGRVRTEACRIRRNTRGGLKNL